jgi:hypothetical protein
LNSFVREPDNEETSQKIKSRHNTVQGVCQFLLSGSHTLWRFIKEQSAKAVHEIPSGRLACQYGWKSNEFEPEKPPIMVATVNWRTQTETA